MRNYIPTGRPTLKPVIATSANPYVIGKDTKLVNVEDACRILKEEKGISYSSQHLRTICRTGQWSEGLFWVKPSRQYLINLDAVYWAIAHGKLA